MAGDTGQSGKAPKPDDKTVVDLDATAVEYQRQLDAIKAKAEEPVSS